MNDLKPFKHGEEGTHAVCNKHNIGDKSVCCECSGKDDCSDEVTNHLKQEEFYVKMARKFHDTYEELAPSFGYETRPDTKQFDPESPNGKLMITVVRHLLHTNNEKLREEIEKYNANRVYSEWLTDGKSKSSYEGDILKDGDTLLGEVGYVGDGFVIFDVSEKKKPLPLGSYDNEPEVIGNIYESKRLLDNTDTKA